MTLNFRIILRATGVSALLILSSCAAYTLVPPQAIAVSKAGMTVTPGTAWNKMPMTMGLNAVAEVWTQDGPALNQLTFWAGLKQGDSLIKVPSGTGKKPPLFKSAMLPQEVVEFVEKSYRVQTSSPMFAVTNLRPASFSGQQGFQFDFDFITQDEVRRKGRAAGAVKNGLLYLMVYEGAAVYYFDRNLAEFDHMIGNAKING
jgi:hypothetical protein